MRERLLFGLFSVWYALPALAQDPFDTDRELVVDACGEGGCCFQGNEQLWVILMTVAFLAISTPVLARIFQNRAIRNQENATTGKHKGISLALFLTTLVLSGSIWTFSGCFPAGSILMIAAAFVLFVIHFAYSKSTA